MEVAPLVVRLAPPIGRGDPVFAVDVLLEDEDVDEVVEVELPDDEVLVPVFPDEVEPADDEDPVLPVVPVDVPVPVLDEFPAEITLNASTQIQVPAELAFFVPVASTARVWVPELSPEMEYTVD